VSVASVSSFLAQRLCRDKGFTLGTVAEARPLADACDLVVTRSDGMSLVIVGIVDRTHDPSRRFPLTLDAVVEIGKRCLGYTGKVNGTKLPVGIQIWEVGGASNPAEREAERARLRQLSRRMPGLTKVVVSAWQLSPVGPAGDVWTTSRFNGFFAGRRYLERVLREAQTGEPRGEAVDDAEQAVAQGRIAALSASGFPWATGALTAAFVAVFALELLVRLRPWHGLLGLDVWTLMATGGLMPALVRNGHWFRLVTAPMLHADAVHLACNGVALFMAGAVLEPLVGAAWLLALFVGSAMAGAVGSLLFNPATVVSVGASGGIMGLLAAALLCLGRLPLGRERTAAQMGLLRVFVPSLVPVLVLRTGGHVDIAAHVGGALAGGLLGMVLVSPRVWPRDEVAPGRRLWARAVAAVGLVGVLFGGWRVAGSYASVRTIERAARHGGAETSP
jgi:rhomboid protease GluP